VTTQPDTAPRPMRGPFSRWPRTADAALAGLVLLGDVFSGSFESPDTAEGFSVGLAADFPIAAYFLLVVGSAVVYWRRSRPLAVLGATLTMVVVWSLVGFPGEPGLGVLVALYAVGRYVDDDRYSYTGVGVGLGSMSISLADGGESAPGIGVGLLLVFLPWYVGRRIRIRGEYLQLLKDRAAYLEKEQAAEAQRAVTEERARIARELHDVVAHRVSLMTVQAGAAKTVAADDPASALQAMEAVEQAGRQALGELRHLLGVIRPDTAGNGLGPQPGLADLPRLVDQLTQAGLDVALTIDGVPTDVPSRVDLSSYRIVQEALTNVLKHAGPDAEVEVHVLGVSGGIAIEVLDTGSGGTILPGSGQGLVGMRERATLLGGTLEAGPRPGGGYLVKTHLPTVLVEP